MFTITQIYLYEKSTIYAVNVWPLIFADKDAAIAAINEEAQDILGDAAEMEQDGEDFVLNDQIVFRITEHQHGY